jgi:NodT family efflux transporter outer membrane factor (OMF) lipoprotein
MVIEAMNWSFRRWLGVLPVALAISGCSAVGPDYSQPQVASPPSWFNFAARPPVPPATTPVGKPPATTPAKPAARAPLQPASAMVAAPLESAWWTLFHDPQLTALETRVLAANLDIRSAGLRLGEARQQRRIVGADQMPNANANANFTAERASSKGIFSALGGSAPSSATNAGTTANGAGGSAGGIPGSALAPFDLYSAGFDASWELDLWGRVRRELESSDASVAASEQARRGAVISVQAEMARDYVQLRGIQRTIAITQENLRTAQSSLKLTQDRAAGGLTTELDVANARALVATIAANLPQLEQQQDAGINQISLLLAEQPGSLRDELVTTKPVPPVPPTVPLGLPSELLLRRPDIAQAESQLHAATADIGVAVADFYPRISLSGSLSLQALQFKDVGNWAARQYAVGPTISLPLFEGGRLRGTLDLRKAQQQDAAITYQKTILQAWHEVANAMDAYEAEQRRRIQLEIAVNAGRQAVGLARQRYQQGIADFLQVLDAERSLLGAQQQLADSTTTISTNLVALYKALGGGWDAS